MNKVHDFWQSLAWSERQSDEAFWQQVYQRFFHNMVNQMPSIGDFDSQRMGVDRLVHLSNNRVIRIDEKKRKKDYGDIALEVKHTKEKSIYSQKVSDGWIEKDLHIDYIAYAIMPSQTVYMLDWIMLQKAYRENKMKWWLKSQVRNNPYFIASAKNEGYYSHNLCVPIDDLYRAMRSSSIVKIAMGSVQEQSA